MKKFSGIVALTAMAFALIQSVPASAASMPELDGRIWEAKVVMDEVMATPDQSIPEELLAKCKAIAIYPNVLKGGFIFGARWGRGVVLKRDEATGKFGPVAFSTIGGGSWGLQIGGSATDLILVIMNERGMQGVLNSKVTLGADAAVAAGPVGRNSEAATDLTLRAGILSYSRSRGLFAGLALEGAVVTQDNNSNTAYYGKYLTGNDILIGNAVPVATTSKELVASLDNYSQLWSKRVAARGGK
jgi:lipid-binding SYLF domain-containing protein